MKAIEKIFLIENNDHAIDWWLFPFRIKRRETESGYKYGEYKDCAVFEYRRCKQKGYQYIAIGICHFVRISIDLHRPV